MNLKNLYICTGVLAILAIITNLLTRTSNAPLQDDRVGSTIVASERLQDAAKVVITTDGTTITLAKGDGNWTLEEKANLPSSYTRINQFARNVAEAKLQRFVSGNPDRIATLGFDGGNSAQFFDASGNTIVAFDLGKETDSGRQFLRYQGEDKAFLVNTTFYIDSNLDSWLEKALVDFDADNVTTIDISLQSGDQLTVERENAESDWTTSASLPEKKILNQSAVSQIASRFSGLNFTATADVDEPNVLAARENGHSFDIALADGNSYTFTIGRQPEVAIEKEVEKEGENGETVTEMEEEIVTPEGPVYFFIAASDSDDPVNGYMESFGFEASSYQFTSLPDSLDALLSDEPEPVTPLVVDPEETEQ